MNINFSGTFIKTPEERDRILKNLQSCIQNVQLKYEMKSTLIATENDSDVVKLCDSLESLLSHGLKSNQEDPLKAVTESLKSKFLYLAVPSATLEPAELSMYSEPSWWYFISSIIGLNDSKRIALLPGIETEMGMARSWLRTSLNEQSLIGIFQVISFQFDNIERHYENWALLADPERRLIIPKLLKNLTSVKFNLNVKDPDLNQSFLQNLMEEALIAKMSHNPKEKKEFVSNPKRNRLISFDTPLTPSTPTNQSNMKFENPEVSSENDLSSITYSLDHFKSALIEVKAQKNHLDRQLNSVSEELSIKTTECLNISDKLNECNEAFRLREIEYRKIIDALIVENENLKKNLADNDSRIKERTKGDSECYEKKLSQVSEMHADLIEFNQNLQTSLRVKENRISQYEKEIAKIRGPTISSASTFDEEKLSDEFNSVNRPCINVWIPSVLLSGGHHVYQVFIRIENEEWSVCRRYSEFSDLNKILQKSIKGVKNLDFPPKKSVGRKKDSLVQSRRKRLQDYLRNVLTLGVLNHDLSELTNKQSLIRIIPFFKEDSNPPKSALIMDVV